MRTRVIASERVWFALGRLNDGLDKMAPHTHMFGHSLATLFATKETVRGYKNLSDSFGTFRLIVNLVPSFMFSDEIT